MMGLTFSPHAEAPSGRRAAILRGALEAFTAHGYAATSIEHIRRASGASTGSIYHHYGGKAGVAAALYAEGLRRYQAGVMAVLDSAADAEGGIRGLARYHLRWIADNRDLARFLLTNREAEVLAASKEALRPLNEVFLGSVRRWVREATERGELRELPYDVFSAAAVGPLQEFARYWVAGDTATPVDEAAELLGDLAWRALAGAG